MGVGTCQRVAVVDISAEGAKLKVTETQAVGQELWLRVFNVERLATVRWAKGGFVGVLFGEMLSSLELHELHRQNTTSAATKLKAEERLAIDDLTLGLAR